MNRLGSATSTYLRQHAAHPVHWQPWDAQALAEARASDRPILLSIGYSACHWCHVMAHESFADPAIGALMNAHFVSIKVDREERPDLDRLYQAAHQLLSGRRGGWPLTLFLTPDDHVPYFGGTYFPPAARHRLPAFAEVLREAAARYRERGPDLERFKQDMRAALSGMLAPVGSGTDIPDEAPIFAALARLDALADRAEGGFGRAPRFPHPGMLEFLLDCRLRYAGTPPGTRAAALLDHALSAMAAGGLFDHLGGGFFRYSTDDTWTIPHFEKMLYDNGPLLWLYAESGRRWGDTGHVDAARQTALWALTEMRDAQGLFHASLDADSEGEEGRYYLWTRDEVAAVLGPAGADFAGRYGLDGAANFEGRWHLRLPRPTPGAPCTAPDAATASARGALLARRATRIRPQRDDKILVAWNALMIRGLVACSRLPGNSDCLDAAERAVDALIGIHWRDGRLLAASAHGQARLNAYLDDYAFLAQAVLDLLGARFRPRWLDLACALADALLTHFEDAAHGGFFFTSHDHEALLERSRSFSDDALPAGSAVAVRVLRELGHLLGEMRYLAAAERALRAAADALRTEPVAHATMLTALGEYLDPPTSLVLRVDSAGLPADWAAVLADVAPARSRVFVLADNEDEVALPELLALRRRLPGTTVTAYLCFGTQCEAPLTTARDLRAALATCQR